MQRRLDPKKIISAEVQTPRNYEIQDASGLLIWGTPDILKVFANKHLYSSARELPLDIDDYLDGVALAWLSDMQRALLAADIEHDEIQEDLMQLQLGIAPGPDGLPADFYKTNADTHTPTEGGLHRGQTGQTSYASYEGGPDYYADRTEYISIQL
ncbi:hypothetical protein NDU88_006356 [Pleurodeles waltl]|uniref:Uncharacterized protein n=1 Tax=Pleurodeles waltl TaxID=8319 RepID=A0AAV7SPL7_PLEWA|nr:hypothetical protein NDU88_006356 [Pleurodeles waltl]